MINAVLMMNCNESLARCLAANDIRIVADKFSNSTEFLDFIYTTDINIDTAVISDEMLKDETKAEFFEKIRSLEPNIRIIIVFSGYRNQYIEAQVSEYKNVYGISDIIYEGIGIDKACLIDVIKKGYIYGYDVNVYDEEEKPIPKEHKCVSIGVMGLTGGSGVTNMAISIAKYIALSEDFNVKVIDLSGTGSLRFAKAKKVTFIVHSGIDIARLEKTSRALVYDFGTPFKLSCKGKLLEDRFSKENLEIFKRCDLKICMCFSDSWHIGKLKYLLNDKAWKKEIDSSYIFLLDTLSDTVKFPKVNIYSRNDKEIARIVKNLFVN